MDVQVLKKTINPSNVLHIKLTAHYKHNTLAYIKVMHENT